MDKITFEKKKVKTFERCSECVFYQIECYKLQDLGVLEYCREKNKFFIYVKVDDKNVK